MQTYVPDHVATLGANDARQPQDPTAEAAVAEESIPEAPRPGQMTPGSGRCPESRTAGRAQPGPAPAGSSPACCRCMPETLNGGVPADRKSTRLNSSHEWISYAVFCSKKK